MRRLRRNSKGNQISEFGPAIFILILAILIPMLVLIYIGFGFCCGWYLNFMSVRACAVVHTNTMPQAIAAQEAAWNASGLPQFAGATVISNTPTRYSTQTDLDLTPAPVDPITGMGGGPRQQRELDNFVRVITVVRITPLLQLPLVQINPWTFTYNSERPIEEKDLEGY